MITYKGANRVDTILGFINSSPEKQLIIAIDGRCASGKTTFANELSQAVDCNVFHTDDFFPRPEQRTDARLAEPGGNFDRERFLEEIINPLFAGGTFAYRRFDCKTRSFSDKTEVTPKRLNIVEGAYSCHPCLFEYYDFRIFMDIQPDEQLYRIALRNPDAVEVFRNKWIPLEEAYFNGYNLRERCNCVFTT